MNNRKVNNNPCDMIKFTRKNLVIKINNAQKKNKNLEDINIDEIINDIVSLWGDILKRDFNDYPSLVENMTIWTKQYLIGAINKGYINDANLYIMLNEFAKGIENFEIIPSGPFFGLHNMATKTIKLQASLDESLIRHCFFHEISHMLTTEIGVDVNSELEKNRISLKIPSEQSKKPGAMVIHDGNIMCDTRYFMQYKSFLRECIAEHMACDIGENFKEKRTVVPQSCLTSDWVTPFNRTYQEICENFITTLDFLSADNCRSKMKELSILSTDPENIILSQIYNSFKSKKPNSSSDLELRKDLKYIGDQIFVKYQDNINVPSTTELKKYREIVEKYKGIEKVTINSRSDINSRIRIFKRSVIQIIPRKKHNKKIK
ncbi:MAG: hypothetical protein R3Y21_00915 [Mycoplasmatota bacterium]